MTTTSTAPAFTHVSADDYAGICNFLGYEARLLDENRLDEWFELLADDFHFRVPVRISLRRADMINDPEAEFNSGVSHQEDTKNTMKVRIQRLGTGWAWAEDPASRISRLVGSISAVALPDGEFEVTSAFHLYRERGLEPSHQMVAGSRHDVLRRVGNNFQVVKRTVYLAHTTITTPNLGLFL